MTHLESLLTRIKELDEKRTPPGVLFHRWRDNLPPEIRIHFDFSPQLLSAFIAGYERATLANECAKLVKIIEVQSDWLKTISRAEYINEYDEKGNFLRMVMPNQMASEALEQAEKIAEGSGEKCL